MMHVLNDATTRSVRGLPRYNDSLGRPWVWGSYENTIGKGFLKVPNSAPTGTNATPMTYTDWVVRFDANLNAPFTAFPARR